MKNYIDTYTNKDIKNIFAKYEAFDKSHTIDRNTLFREIENLKDGNKNLNKLVLHQVVRKYNNRYYFCEESEKNKSIRIRLITIKLLPYIILTVGIMTLIILMFQNSKQNNSALPQNTVTNTSYQESKTTAYELKDFNMKIVVPSNMSIVTGSGLDYLLGEGSSDFYEFAIYNSQISFTCFIKDTTSDMVDTYWENVNKTYSSDSNYSIVSNKKEENISGFNFITFEAKSKSYNELFLGLFKDNKFISFQYTYPTSDESNGKNILTEMINKLN